VRHCFEGKKGRKRKEKEGGREGGRKEGNLTELNVCVTKLPIQQFKNYRSRV
jgi:hypothetical protein